MSGNRKKAKRRTAKALQNLRKTPEKRIPIINETEKHHTSTYDPYLRCEGCGGMFTLCDPDGIPFTGKNNEPIYVTHKMARSLTELTPYGERLVEHYMKLRNGIEDPDFVFEDEDEEYEEEYDDEDDDDSTGYKTEFTEYGKRLIEHYAKAYNGIDDPDFVFEDEDEEYEEEYDDDDEN